MLTNTAKADSAINSSFDSSTVTEQSRDTNRRRLQETADREFAYGYDNGYIYCARNYSRKIVGPRSAVIYLSLDETPIEIASKDERVSASAFLVKPLVVRTVHAPRVDMVSIAVNPAHPVYRALATAPAADVLTLDRASFGPLDHKIAAASRGTLNFQEAVFLHNAAIETVAAHLPPPKPLDPRIADVIQRIHASPVTTLGELAHASNLSYHRMSHLFSTNIGISVRSYQLWYKIDLAWRLIHQGHKLADIATLSGFCDAAHLCHIFQDAFGVPISYHLENMRIHAEYSQSLPRSMIG